MSAGGPCVTVLTSAVGLGIYIPALLVQHALRACGRVAQVEVLESYYSPASLRSHIAHREAHHRDFGLARIAHRMARDVQHCIDPAPMEALLGRWAREGRRHFIAWSGFWLPILERYRALCGLALEIDHCRIDAEISASFRIHAGLRARGREIWLWHGEGRRLVHEIPVGGEAPVPFARRGRRLLVHGGGWGIGTYLERAETLAQAPFSLDLVVHGPEEAKPARPGDRCFRLDPSWEPWKRNRHGEHDFPPMQRVDAGHAQPLAAPPGYHAMHDVVRHAQAVISKPGGCTLIDSLAAATPVVLLEPYGEPERRNGEIWRHLGFGIGHDEWRATGYDPAVLEGLHRNILARRRDTVDYVRAYAQRLASEAAA
jgi:hypothetical protein